MYVRDPRRARRRARETVTFYVDPMPEAASIPPAVPTAYKGAKALGDVDLTIYNGDGGGGLSSLSAFTGVGFTLNPVAEVYGSYNVQQEQDWQRIIVPDQLG